MDCRIMKVVPRNVTSGAGLVRIVVALEEASCVLVADPDEVVAEKVGSTSVIGMVMRVNQMRDGVADAFSLGDFVHRPAEIVADRRRHVEEDDPLVGGQECRLVGPVGDPEQVPFNSPDVITLLVQGQVTTEGWGRSRAAVARWAHQK